MAYIYHIVPDDFNAEILYPLHELQKIDTDVYNHHSKKYENRPHISKLYIPQLDCYRHDVIHFGAVHPNVLRQTLLDIGIVKHFAYYEIDTKLLDNSKMIIYRNVPKDDMHNLTADDFVSFNENELEQWAKIPDATIAYYEKKYKEGKDPLLFLFVPHVLYKGNIPLTNIQIQHT